VIKDVVVFFGGFPSYGHGAKLLEMP
jgi:hypothetical protein